MERKYGRIKISTPFVEDHPDDVAKVFTKLEAVVLHCEHDFANGNFNYMLYSPLFNLVPLGEIVPLYEITVKVEYDEGKIINFDVIPIIISNDYYQPRNAASMELMLTK